MKYRHAGRWSGRIIGAGFAFAATIASAHHSFAAFFDHVRTDPQFYFTKAEDLLARFRAIEAKIWAAMPRLFADRPKAAFEVRALPALGGQRGTE